MTTLIRINKKGEREKEREREKNKRGRESQCEM